MYMNNILSAALQIGTEDISGLEKINNIMMDRILNPFLIPLYIFAGIGFRYIIKGIESKVKLSKNVRFWVGLFIFYVSIGGMMIIVTKGALC